MHGLKFCTEKCVVRQKTRVNTGEIKWKGTCDQVTDTSNKMEHRILTYKDLYDIFVKRSPQLFSDGAVLVNGTIKV